MNPQQLQQFEQMQRRITELESVTNLNSFQMLVRRLGEKSKVVIGKELSTTVDTDVDRTISIPVGGGTAQVLDYPDILVRVTLDGKPYRIGLYDESRF